MKIKYNNEMVNATITEEGVFIFDDAICESVRLGSLEQCKNDLYEDNYPSRVLAELETLIGTEMDIDNIITAFGDFTEGDKTEVIVNKSCNNGYDYIAYINAVDSTQFLIWVDDNNVITDVKIA